MDGYTSSSYGDAFADVYDEWYADLADRDATVDVVAALTPPAGRVLELGVGTGRMAIPLAATLGDRAATVVGLDASAAMLDRLAARDVDALVEARHGDMVDDLPAGPFDVVLVAYNTLFNLLTASRQEQCLAAVGRQLADAGLLLVEAFVPEEHPARRDDVAVRSMSVGEVVLSVSCATSDQRVDGHYISISEAGGVRLRPWAIRWCTPDQLDDMARRAGLAPVGRWASFTGEQFDEHSARHVSAYAVAGQHEEASTRVRKVLG